MVATPTTPTPAFRFGEKTDDPLQMYLADIFTVPANLAGIPGLSRPLRLRRTACPWASSSWAGPSTRRRSSALGAAYQRATTHHRAEPPL